MRTKQHTHGEQGLGVEIHASRPHRNYLTPQTVPLSWDQKHSVDHDYHLGVANDLRSRREAYALIYKRYLEKGYVGQHASGLWFSMYDALPKTTTLTVKDKIKTIGTATIVTDSIIGMPADSLYPAELSALRNADHRLAELVGFGFLDEDHSGLSPIKLLYAGIYEFAKHVRGRSHLIMTVNPKHVSFYCQRLGFIRMGSVQKCTRVQNAPAVLLILNFDQIKDKINVFASPSPHIRPHESFMRRHTETKMSKVMGALKRTLNPMSENELRYFFTQRPELIQHSNDKIRAQILNLYPAYDLDDLFGTHERCTTQNDLKWNVSKQAEMEPSVAHSEHP